MIYDLTLNLLSFALFIFFFFIAFGRVLIIFSSLSFSLFTFILVSGSEKVSDKLVSSLLSLISLVGVFSPEVLFVDASGLYT